jgi:hypothetical protein
MTIGEQPSGVTDTRPQPRLTVPAWRESIVQGFIRVEDAVYAGLGTLLAALALALLVAVAAAFVRALLGATLPELLDRILLILMIVELPYTVKVSFREHALVPETTTKQIRSEERADACRTRVGIRVESGANRALLPVSRRGQSGHS